MAENKLYCIGLTDKENLFFQRIVKLSVNRRTHQFVFANNQQDADLLVVQGDQQSIDRIEINDAKKAIIVAGDLKANKNYPEIVLPRPFLMSRVLKILDQAVDLIAQPIETPAVNTQKVVETSSITAEKEQDDNESEASTNEDKKQLKALIIDDSLPVRMQLKIILDDSHIDSELAESGEKGLEFAVANDYDLVFLDIMMPGIDGYEVCEAMRKMDKMKKTPIIMLSGKTSPLDEVKGVIAGATTYMTKPINVEELQAVLSRMMKWMDNFQAKSTTSE